MKRIVLIGALVAALALVGCAGQASSSGQGANGADSANAGSTSTSSTDSSTDSSTGGAQIANPYTEYESLYDACQAAGFAMDIPETLGVYGNRSYQVLNAGQSDAMIEADYYTSDEGNQAHFVVRKAPGSDDISGDCNTYAQMRLVYLGPNQTACTVQGNSDGSVSLATWQIDGYSFSLGAYDGASLTEDELATYFEQID